MARLPRGTFPLRVLRVASSWPTLGFGGGGGGGCVSGTSVQNSVGSGPICGCADRAAAGGEAVVASFSQGEVAEVTAAAECDDAGGDEEEGRRRSLREEGGVSRAHTWQRESDFNAREGEERPQQRGWCNLLVNALYGRGYA